MVWSEYLKSLLSEEKCLDSIKVNIEETNIELPKIIKASVFMLQKMIENQGVDNLFVFPDNEQIPFLFMLSNVIYGVLCGKIENRYSPEDFKEGQILKIGNCVTQFIKIDEHPDIPGHQAIFLRFSDVTSCCCLLDKAPFFQITDTKKGLSTYSSYVKTREKLKTEGKAISNLKGLISHINGSVAYISTIAECERKEKEIQIDGEKLFDCLLVAKADYLGNLQYYRGKYVGTPALIFSSQIAHINEVISKGINVKSVIINLNQIDIYSQLEELDDLLRKRIPVLCIVDTVKSMNLKELINRNFNVWRWDADSLTDIVCDNEKISAERKIRKCINSKVEYHEIKSCEVCEAFNKVYYYNNKMENESSTIEKLYSYLISFLYKAIRNIYIEKKAVNNSQLELLRECSKALEKEKPFIDQQMYIDFHDAINCFCEVFDNNSFPKIEAIYNLIISERFEKFYIICSNRDEKERVKLYWEKKLYQKDYKPKIYVVHPREFINLQQIYADTVIVASWFGGKILKNILYGYKVSNIHIFIYECENMWRKVHSRTWKIGLNNEFNKTIIKKSFSENVEGGFEKAEAQESITENKDEILRQQDDLDLIIQENTYRRYAAREHGNEEMIVDAKPIGFAGGEFALLTEGHKLIVVTNIIFQIGKQIEKKEVDKLQIGDFIVVRETNKDIIREVADKILEANDKLEYRKTAALWQEALKIEEAFTSIDDIYQRLVEEGCKKNFQTVKNWLFSEDLIVPQDEGDLRIIAKVTGDSVLVEKIEEIYKAGNYIKKTHVKAGRILSVRLAECVASKLMQNQIVDPINIWDPIEFELEDVGHVKVLKIIDIGSDYIRVDTSNVNKVLTEEKSLLCVE